MRSIACLSAMPFSCNSVQVRPYVHKILVVIEPLLIDEDYYARVEVSVPLACSSHMAQQIPVQSQSLISERLI
jgi:hypothetical protein